MWEDPRELHRVVVEFDGPAPALESVKLQYWGSWWPERHLPKDREPGGGEIGWLELGNWHKYGWRTADTEARADGSRLAFTFRPVNAAEFPKVKEYPATFRYTLKIRITSDQAPPSLKRIEAFTDSVWKQTSAHLVWREAVQADLKLEAFNGAVEVMERRSPKMCRVQLRVAANADPNTFDRTLVTVRNSGGTFTFRVDDLELGPLFLPHLGVAVLPGKDERDYRAVENDWKGRGAKTLYDLVSERSEQTWRAAWDGIPRKKSHIYLPLGLDGGRQRFRLDADGSISFRSNDQYLKRRPGAETPRLELEQAPVQIRFGPPAQPIFRTIEEESLPICQTTWLAGEVQVQQTAFVTMLDGAKSDGPVPQGDAVAVALLRFTVTNGTAAARFVPLPLQYRTGNRDAALRVDAEGFVWSGDLLRGQYVTDASPADEGKQLKWTWTLGPGKSSSLVLKVPYVILTQASEREALKRLDFNREFAAVAGYWRKRLNESARLHTPEPMLNEFYRAHAGHLLINCEREPGSDRRFARVGSFGYGAYGNESCMMVVDLDRRGYHKEAQECLDAWLHYQGTVGLPGDFSSKEGVLYGAGGYEAGGYNQHHGWILWCLAEHYRFTRDEAWLRRSASGILSAAEWIIRETRRTADRHELERGLLPAGSLEDIGDWWTWLSTSCYTWRGLDAAAWALEQIKHADAQRIRQEADAYHAALLRNFRSAAERSPVIRLRDGTAVPHIPSHVHRRGRCFGWICETLEGALHLLITRAIDPKSREAEWILKDYEDNLFLSNQYGYTLDDFDKYWFGRGGMSMQACLLLDVEPYLYRDDVKHALRGVFNALAVSYFPDVRMNTEHALPNMDDWRGDHYKSSDESNAAGWLRYLFVREEGDDLVLGQAVPRTWLEIGKTCGIERAATHFGVATIAYSGGQDLIKAHVEAPQRNPPSTIRLRFRDPRGRAPTSVTVNGKTWKDFQGEWVRLPGGNGSATVVARYGPP
ncbi:MAG: hypothetical protein HY735_34210 [Verrucomicrobia bacterium]|nr:hypothetical protein [Verrucomicrobiota bacterium]